MSRILTAAGATLALVAIVALVVVINGVTLPTTVTCSVVPATCSDTSMTASWPARRSTVPSHLCRPGAETLSL